MKIQEVIFAAIICCYAQTVKTTFDDEFIDPTDMEHYDQTTKSLKFTLKERESHKMFKGFLQRILKSAEKCGLADEENRYDTEVILTKQAHTDISSFLKDKLVDPEVVQDHLNTILINFRKHNEDEWKLKFKEFFHFDVTKVHKLRITEDMFAAHFMRILENTQEVGQTDEESHYDAEVILTRQGRLEISNFLKDKPFDPDVVRDHLNTILINFKKHNKDEWKVKFKEFYQMDIAGMQKLQVAADILAKHFKRVVKKAQRTGQTFMDGKIHLDYIEVEIDKFLNNEDWDQRKLELILENVTFNNEEGVNLWICFWTSFLVCVLSHALPWIMKQYFWRKQAQNEARDRVEEPEDIGHREESVSTPVPESAGQMDVLQNFRSGRQKKTNAEQEHMDEGAGQRSQIMEKKSPAPWDERQKPADVQNTKESGFLRTVKTTIQNDDIESIRGGLQTEPGVLQEEKKTFSNVALQNLHPHTDQENCEHTCSSEEKNQTSPSPNVGEIKEEISVVTNQTISQSLSNERTQGRSRPGVEELTDSPDYTQKLLCTVNNMASEEKENVLDAPHIQDSSLNVDEEPDFIVISDSAPQSLRSVHDEDC